MPNGDKLSMADFAKAIKAKYPDYASVDDHELAGAVLKKYPEYRDRVITLEPVRKGPKVHGTFSDFLASTQGSAYPVMSPTGIATSPQIPARTQAEVLGAGIGGTELAGAAKGLPWLIRTLAGASGAGAGAGAGAVATGASPKEALATAAGTTAVSLPFAGVAESPFLKWLTSSKDAGAKLLNMAEAKAGHLPVELSPRTNEIVEQIVEQGKLGGKTPKVISDLLERVGPSERMSATAKPGPLTYREARILQGNASELSAEEAASLKGRAKGLIKQFARSFAQDVQKTADAGGVGKQHAAGMKEYAMASSRARAVKGAVKATPYVGGVAGGATGLWELYKSINR